MLKKFFVLFFIGVLAFTATGCTLFGDYDDDDSVIAAKVIKAVIKKPKAGGGLNMLGNLRAGIRAAVSTEVVTGATVTLTMADGSVFTMTDNGNGEYSATVSNLDGASGFIIEARKGDLLVQNMVTDLANTDLTAPIETNHLTTAFAQVAISAANVLATQTGIKVASLADLIKNVTSISIDYSELKRQVEDEGNVTYESSRNIVTVALSEAVEGDGTEEPSISLLEKIISGTLTSEEQADLNTKTEVVFTTNIWEDKVTEPTKDQIPMTAPVADKEAIDTVADTYIQAFIKVMSGSGLDADEKNNLSAILAEDTDNEKGFILNGMTKPVLLAQTTAEDDDLDRFVGSHSLVKVDDNTYLIHVKGTAYMKTGGSFAVDSTSEGYSFTGTNPTKFELNGLESSISEFPVIIRRHGDSWKIHGNRIKVDDIEVELHYGLNLDAPNSFTNFWVHVEDTNSFPVESVTLTGSKLPAGGLILEKDANEADSNTWHYWHTPEQGDKYTSSYPHDSWPLDVTHTSGTKYTYEVKFTDGTTQTFHHKIPQIAAGYAPFKDTEVSVETANGNLSLTWPKNPYSTQFEQYDIEVRCYEDGGDSRVLESDITDINTTSAKFAFKGTSYELIPDKHYTVHVHSSLKNGLSQHFNKSFMVPDPEVEATVAMSKALSASTKTVAQGAAGITPPEFGGPASIRAAVSVDVGFPTGTQFYDSYTAYAPIGEETNIFSIPSPFGPVITHNLMQLLNASGNEISYTGEAPYYFSASPVNMNMLVVFSAPDEGLSMELEIEDYPLIDDTNDYVLPFAAVGTITTKIGNDNYEIRIEASVDVSKRGAGEVPTVEGMGLQGTMYKNNQPFQIDGQDVTIPHGAFDVEGIQTCYFMAGGKNIGVLSRDDGVLKLILMDEQGNNREPIIIQ